MATRSIAIESPRTRPQTLEERAVTTVRMLAVDAVEKAKSGHPGLPLGAADHQFVVWQHFLRFNPDDPAWPNRDRYVFSAGHGCMLLYGFLHLYGYDLPLEEIKNFRQWGSRTPGHPEHGLTPGVEATTGPLGQGVGNAVGMALAGKMLAARFTTQDFAPITYRVFALFSDGDLMEGVASEAASFAGHHELGNLIAIYDDNHITIEGDTALTFSEDVGARFDAYGWHVQHVDGHDRTAVRVALEAAVAESERPSLIVARTHIAYGAPTKHDTAGAHGSPLGPEETARTKEAYDWPQEPAFLIPEDVRAFYRERSTGLKKEYENWQRSLTAWKAAHLDLAKLWDAHWTRAVPEDLFHRLLDAAPKEPGETRKIASKILQTAAAAVPALVGGSADLDPSTLTKIEADEDVGPGRYKGRTFHFGVREHGMGAILNGLAYSGAFIPNGSTFLIFSDYMRPPMRLAALTGLQVIYVFTHDSVFLGEDGPTHESVEQLAGLRSVIGLAVVRPADGPECAAAWALALARRERPTALVLTRQKVEAVERDADVTVEDALRGGYVVVRATRTPVECVIIGTGSELPLAIAAGRTLAAEGRAVQVVSMPCVEVFDEQDAAYRASVLPRDARVAVVEAARGVDWYRLIGRDGLVIGVQRYGASAPYKVIAEKLGFTTEAVTVRVRTWLGAT
jgi:transketolase